MKNKKFTEIAASLILNVRDLAGWGFEFGNLTQDDLEFEVIKRTPALRREAAQRLIESGLSQRKAAEVLGVTHTTIQNDVANNLPKDGNKVATSNEQTTRELLSQSDQNDWRTPRKYLDAARAVMDGIDLDPASSAEANKTVLAAKFYTEADDGLLQPWKGKVWLNPPYGGNARLFIERLIKEYQVGNVTAACALLNSHPTETKWFQELFNYTICFIRGRIDFGGPSREVSSTSTHGSAIAYLGNDPAAFTSAFEKFGAVVARVS